MKNFIKNGCIGSFFSFSLSVVSMDVLPDKYRLISFKADDGIVHIEKKNIPLIGALYERYDLYLKSRYKNKPIVIPLLKGTLKEEIVLVNGALNIRPDHFGTYFNGLPENERDMLLKSSLVFSRDGKKIGLHVPDITKRVLAIILNKDLFNRVGHFFENKEKEDILFHCRKKLINDKSVIGMVKHPRIIDFYPFEEIDLQSLFMNGYFEADSIKQPIPLPINNTTYHTYAYNFISPHVEYRITNNRNTYNSSDYLLWIVNHKNPAVNFAVPLAHSSPIIGCCFSATKTDVEYVISYSHNDIIFSTITMLGDGYDIKTVRVDTQSNGQNVAAVYCNANNELFVGMYKGIDNLFIYWTMDGIASAQSVFPFKQYGLLEKVMIKKNDVYEDEAFAIFGSCGRYGVHKWKDLHNNQWTFEGSTGMVSLLGTPADYDCSYGRFFQKNNEIFMYKHLPSPFTSVEKATKKQQQSSWLTRWTQGVIDDFNFVPDTECYKKYSKSGNFILSNSLSKKSGVLYVTTQILDSMHHKALLSLDTIYCNFAGVGFDQEEKKLIFMHHIDKNAEVLLWDQQDKEHIAWLEKEVLKNLGTVSVIADLLKEVKNNGYIVLKKSDPICTMFRELAKESAPIGSFLEKCFPFTVVK